MAAVSVALCATGRGGPSEADFRQQGYTDCANWQDYVAPQMNDPSVECLEDGELTEFRDSTYYIGVCPNPNWC